MAIIINIDVVLAKRKMSVTELSERVGITMANISILKTFSFLSSAARKRLVTGTNFLPTSLFGSTTSRSAIGAVPGISAA